MVVHRGCAHLQQNHLTRIALTASAKALAPSSPTWLFSRKSCGDRLAGLVVFRATDTVPEPRQPRPRTEEDGVRFADPTECVRDKVCWASVLRAGIAAHHVETTTVDKVMKSSRGPAVDTRSATCMSPAEFRISKHMLFSTPRRRFAANFKCYVLQPGGCRRCGATFVPPSCVMCYTSSMQVFLATKLS